MGGAFCYLGRLKNTQPMCWIMITVWVSLQRDHGA